MATTQKPFREYVEDAIRENRVDGKLIDRIELEVSTYISTTQRNGSNDPYADLAKEARKASYLAHCSLAAGKLKENYLWIAPQESS